MRKIKILYSAVAISLLLPGVAIAQDSTTRAMQEQRQNTQERRQNTPDWREDTRARQENAREQQNTRARHEQARESQSVRNSQGVGIRRGNAGTRRNVSEGLRNSRMSSYERISQQRNRMQDMRTRD